MVCEDKELIEKLEERLRWYQEEATEEEFDADEVDAVCTILRKQSPVVFTDKKEAYRKLMERIREEDTGETEEDTLNKEGKLENGEEKAGKTGRKRYRAAIILGVCVLGAGILFMNSSGNSRANGSLLTMILTKVGVIEVGRTGVNQEEDIVGIDKKTKYVYDSWSELDKEMKSQIRVPEYIPEGFSLYNVKYITQENRKCVVGSYYNKTGQHLFFRIYLLEGEAGTAIVAEEDASKLVSEYSDENRFCYAYDDEYVCLFSMDDCAYRISGDIRLEEMVKVAEGFGSVRQD